MAQDDDIADDVISVVGALAPAGPRFSHGVGTKVPTTVISGSLKRSKSCHSDYGTKTYGDIKDLAAANPPDQKARHMKKLIEQAERLRRKGKGRRS